MPAEKELGKINKVRLGLDGDGRFGLSIELSFGGMGVVDAKHQVWQTRSPHAQWSEQDRADDLAKMGMFIMRLLTDAKKSDISQLPGTPVEVEFEINSLKSWRVLTEVL